MRLLVLLALLAPLGCAVAVGPVGFAVGDAYVERDEAGNVAEIRGGAVSAEFASIWEVTVGRAFDAALAFLGRLPVRTVAPDPKPPASCDPS
ncbi:MAG: hypothetical protein ACQGVC_17085 [Myxococcota bacterium]